MNQPPVQNGLSVWLYRLARDEQLLNQPPRRVGFEQLQPNPLPLRLHYLMTPIVTNTSPNDTPELEHLILGKVLQIFNDHPVLSGVDLRDDLTGTTTDLFVRLEPQSLEEITRVWDALERSYQLCVSYEVSVVMIESDLEVRDVTPVDAFIPEYGVITARETPA